MSDYTITTDFGAKDSLPSGNAAKIIKGSEFTTEFTNIKTAVNTKADTTGDTFTGAVTFDAAVTNNAAVTVNSTATITGDLTVDTNTLFVDVSANKVGIGNTSPSTDLHIKNTNAAQLLIESGETATGFLLFGDASDLNIGSVSYDHSDNSMRFETDDTERMRIDSSGNVGIGTTSPNYELTVGGGTNNSMQIISSTTGSGSGNGLRIWNTGSSTAMWNYDNTPTLFGTNNTERMRIDSSGNVGIGTTNPATALHIDSSDATALTIQRDSGASSNVSIKYDGASQDYYTGVASASEDFVIGTNANLNTNNLLRVTSAGKVGIGTTNPNGRLNIQSSASGQYLLNLDYADATDGGGFYQSGSTDLSLFLKNSSATQTVQIATAGDSYFNGGNVLVGTTVTNSTAVSSGGTTTGVEFQPSGELQIGSDGDKCAIFNRQSSDGEILRFRKDGSTVGSISVTGSATSYNTSSDERLKENITDAEDAGSKVDAIQIRQFDWKADGSHQNYGVIAQELINVAPEAVSEGDTEEDMMGVDYSKLVPMLIKEVQTLRNRVAQLENN